MAGLAGNPAEVVAAIRVAEAPVVIQEVGVVGAILAREARLEPAAD